MGLGHEFRHGDLVRHRLRARAAGLGGAAASAAARALTGRSDADAAALAAPAARPAGGQREAPRRGPPPREPHEPPHEPPQGAGLPPAGPGGGSRGRARSPAQLGPGPSACRAEGSAAACPPERAPRRTRTAGGNYPPPSRGPRAPPAERGGSGPGAVAGRARGGAARRAGPPIRALAAAAAAGKLSLQEGRRRALRLAEPLARCRRALHCLGVRAPAARQGPRARPAGPAGQTGPRPSFPSLIPPRVRERARRVRLHLPGRATVPPSRPRPTPGRGTLLGVPHKPPGMPVRAREKV